MGFWLVLYLGLHLLTNSQAALWWGDEGSGFVRMVNALERLPYLHTVEVVLIGIPLLIHGVWGVHRALTSRSNDMVSGGKKPSLPYERNKAYRWQRLSSWILLLGIVGHVIQMRFVSMPVTVMRDHQEMSVVKIGVDQGVYALADRLDVTLLNQQDIEKFPALASYNLRSDERLAMADSPGKAMLFMVRDTFKSPAMVFLYTLFVLAAAFHAFNGFWTFLITWGLILSYRAQRSMIPVCWIGAAVLSFLGLAAIFGSYWNG